MTTEEVASDLVSMCSAGQFDEAAEKHYAPNIVSVEASGDGRETIGIDAIRKKIEWWNAAYNVNWANVEGPWLNEPFFAVRYEIDVTHKESGNREVMKEIAIYEVRDGKIIHERFFWFVPCIA